MNASSPTLTLNAARPKPSMLPILTVLFLISYGLLAFLVVEQNRTMMNQRAMIQQLLGDSQQLAALKGKIVGKHARSGTPPKTAPQAPTAAPDGRPTDSQTAQRQSSRLKKPDPLNPPKVAADKADVRRSLVVI